MIYVVVGIVVMAAAIYTIARFIASVQWSVDACDECTDYFDDRGQHVLACELEKGHHGAHYDGWKKVQWTDDGAWMAVEEVAS